MAAQAEAPEADEEPEGQASQVLELAPEKVPAPQLAHMAWLDMPIPEL